MKNIEQHEYIIKDLIDFIGEDSSREGLLETPKRVLKAWKEWTKGYKIDIPSLFKVFEDGANNYDEMVLLKEIPFHSFCEHHMASIIGVCSVAYIPNGKIVGLSKIARLVEAYACRLQVQERMTVQIADAIEENLHPKGVGVIINASHLCMSSRGIKTHGVDTITSAMRGVFLEKENNARIEFLNLIKK